MQATHSRLRAHPPISGIMITALEFTLVLKLSVSHYMRHNVLLCSAWQGLDRLPPTFPDSSSHTTMPTASMQSLR